MLSLLTGIAIGTGELHYAREGFCEELLMEDIPPRTPVLGCIMQLVRPILCSCPSPFFLLCAHESGLWSNKPVLFPTAVRGVLLSSFLLHTQEAGCSYELTH